MLFVAFTKALRNLLLPGIIKLFLLSLMVYVLGWMLLAAGLTYLMTALGAADSIPFGLGWLAGSVGSMLIAWMLFPLLYPVLISFFDEAMADKIERSDYPQLMRATPPFWPTFGHDVMFSIKALLLNIICFPLYFIPLVGQLLYFGMNGYLLGAQFFRMAAGRRIPKLEADGLLSRNRTAITTGGALIMLCATVPILNLAAPVLGVATMLHLFHALSGANKVTVI